MWLGLVKRKPMVSVESNHSNCSELINYIHIILYHFCPYFNNIKKSIVYICDVGYIFSIYNKFRCHFSHIKYYLATCLGFNMPSVFVRYYRRDLNNAGICTYHLATCRRMWLRLVVTCSMLVTYRSTVTCCGVHCLNGQTSVARRPMTTGRLNVC